MEQHKPAIEAPLFHNVQPKRKPGRPKGSVARVMQEARALGVHHFAFVRSSILGLDLADSFNRYMAWAETTTDLRFVQNRRDALLKQIIEAGRALDATLPPPAKITQMLDLLRSDAKVKPAVELPSLEDWVEAEGMDPDMWSEADLLDEYKAHFGLDNADAQEAGANIAPDAARAFKALGDQIAADDEEDEDADFADRGLAGARHRQAGELVCQACGQGHAQRRHHHPR